MRTPILILLGQLAAAPPAFGQDSISAGELSALLGDAAAPLVLDVRSEREYRAGHVPGALHIRYNELPAGLAKLPAGKQQPIVVYCERGPRAWRAESILESAGYTEVRELKGHMVSWRAGGYPTE